MTDRILDIRKLLTPASLGVENPGTATAFVGMPTA
jgi:hypothetical protein